jgi:hypothetical protein
MHIKILFILIVSAMLIFSLTDSGEFNNKSESRYINKDLKLNPDLLQLKEPADNILKENKNIENGKDENIETSWKENVMRNIEKEEYNIVFDDDKNTFRSANRKNNISFEYGKDGFTAKSMQKMKPLFDVNDETIPEDKKKYEEIPEWNVSLKLSEVVSGASHNNSVKGAGFSLKNSKLKTENNNAFIEDNNIRINYTNSEEGMRQDFIIRKKPEGSGKLKLNFSADTKLRIIVGADALTFKDDKGTEKMKYSALKVWDANGKILHAYFDKNIDEKINKGKKTSGLKSFAIKVNDDEAVYPVTIDPISTSPSWTVTGGYSFGSTVCAAGDINGDGYGDVLVGAKENSTNYSSDGKVYCYLGSASGLSVTSSWSVIGSNDFSRLGHSISTAGDVNGDGYSDVILGEPGYKISGITYGRVLLFLGSASGLPASPSWTGILNTPGNTGSSVSTAGDVNGDGYSDIIVGSSNGYKDTSTHSGVAYLYLGSASGLPVLPDWTVRGTGYLESFGSSVCSAGDINGDGYSDVVVGAQDYSYSASSSKEGAAYAYYGSASGLPLTANWFKTGIQPGYNFGYKVHTAGDVNGDGYSDVVVGAPNNNGTGKAYVYHGSASGLSASPDWTATGEANARFGFAAGTAGDFNGDGYADLIVGAYYNSGGKALVYQGSAAGLSAAAIWIKNGDSTTVAYGFCVGTAGDVNGDGYSDIIVGAYEPKAFAYNGSPSGFPDTYSWTYNGSQSFGWTVASAGDLNGDGYGDVIIGAPDYNNGTFTVGRFYIFQGSPNGLSPAPSLIKTGTNSGSSIYRVGICVAPAGDVNGDGYSDVAVGISNGVFAVNSYGGVEIYYGSASGISSTPSWTKSSTVSGDEFGNSVASAGDINGDGYSDLIAGAWKLNTESGAAYCYYGSENGLSAVANWSAAGAFGSWYGYSVSSAGDVNGDGYSDVVVGAPNLNSYGGAYVYHGSAAGLSVSPDWFYQTPYTNSKYGISVACAGDVNGDGYSDVLIGLYKYTIGIVQAGAAACYYGSSTGLNTLYPEWFDTAPNEYSQFEFGRCVSSAGDVNGDGYSDIIVSASYPFGDVYCYYGSPSGPSLVHAISYNNNSTLRFGFSAASAGDVDGDGYSDLLIGAYFTGGGHAFLYKGNSASGKSSFVQQFKPGNNSLLGTGGWTGTDGQVKYGIFGRSSYGRADGKIVYEHKLRGTAFNSLSNTSGSGTGTFYQDLGLNGIIINSNASGLNSEKEYKWRARVQYSQVNNPYQKLGPWRFYNSQFPLPYEGFKPKSVPVIPLNPAFALNFDGVNDYVALPDSLTSSLTQGEGITVEYMFKGTDIKSAVVFKNSNGFIISGDSGKHVISSDGGFIDGLPIGGGIYDGEWHQIVFTWKRNTVNGFKSYLDGFLQAERNTADVTLPAITAGGSLGGSPATGNYMSGSMDEVRLWNRAMTNEEIEYRYLCILNGNVQGLRANFHFNQGYSNHNNSTVTTLYDTSMHSNNGSLINFALQGTNSNWIAPGAGGFECISAATLNLSVIPQGFYNTSGNLNMRDTVTVYLHSPSPPYAVIDSAKSVIDSVSFNANFTFWNASTGNYYFSVRHRNSIETWSSYDESMNTWNTLYYSFTFGTYSAYGGNLAYLASFKYGIYSGDVNQDGIIDGTDVSNADNDAFNSVSGYVNTDVTGDSFVDAADVSIVDNNAYNSVSVLSP